MIDKKGHSSTEQLPRPVMPGYENFIELYYFAWELAAKHVAYSPGLASPYYMDEAFARNRVWLWDTCFMGLFCRYAPDLYPGIESLDNFYSVQREDGYISMTHEIDSGADSFYLPWGRINPPLASWLEFSYWQTTGDRERIKRVLPHLIKLDQWIEKNRRRRDGSYWFVDCGSSGMDNSPRSSRFNLKGDDIGFVDLASQQCLSARCISELYKVVNDNSASGTWHEHFIQRCDFVNKYHWCSRSGFYHDTHTGGDFTNCRTIASFWPLLANAPDKKQAAALVEHLLDENEFNRPHPVPTLAYNDPNYSDDGRYWQGGVWAPANYMIVRGLKDYGYHELAYSITKKHLDMMYKVWRKHEPHTIWECYAPESPEPAKNDLNSCVRPDFVGWSGLGPIAMFIENILGINANYSEKKIIWRSNCLEEHGIDNMRFGPYIISLRAKARKHIDEMPQIEIKAPCEIKIEFKTLNF